MLRRTELPGLLIMLLCLLVTHVAHLYFSRGMPVEQFTPLVVGAAGGWLVRSWNPFGNDDREGRSPNAERLA